MSSERFATKLIVEIDHIRDSAETEGLIRSFCSDSKNSSERNARLALLFFYATETLDGRRSQDDLLSALTDYFQVFSAKYVSFSDVERWLPYLNIERQKRLLVDTAKISQDAQPPSGDSEVGSQGRWYRLSLITNVAYSPV